MNIKTYFKFFLRYQFGMTLRLISFAAYQFSLYEKDCQEKWKIFTDCCLTASSSNYSSLRMVNAKQNKKVSEVCCVYQISDTRSLPWRQKNSEKRFWRLATKILQTIIFNPKIITIRTSPCDSCIITRDQCSFEFTQHFNWHVVTKTTYEVAKTHGIGLHHSMKKVKPAPSVVRGKQPNEFGCTHQEQQFSQ